jgi:hypothetical protein
MLRALSIVGLVLCAGSLLPAGAAGLLNKKSPPKMIEIPAQPVYYNGVELRFVPETPVRRTRIITVGPWTIGGRVGDGKPSDKRLNLYIVAPGKQYQLPGESEFDHNLIISALPKEDKQAEYDVWLALVLDPTLKADFQDEHELIIAAQGKFTPLQTFDVKQSPSFAFLQKYLNISDNTGLAEYFRDGELPRVLIIPAKFALKARVESIAVPEPAQQTEAAPASPATPAAGPPSPDSSAGQPVANPQ